jgi:hypothetical protein
MAVGLGLGVALGAAVTLGVGDGGADGDGAALEAPPVPHATSVRPRASTRSVTGVRDAMMTSGWGA